VTAIVSRGIAMRSRATAKSLAVVDENSTRV
jgi:hypothetical protein